MPRRQGKLIYTCIPAITGDVITNQIPAFIDFEASSLDLISSYPIEAGLCLDGKYLHSWLIKPCETWLDWSESAEQIHGIERDELTQNGEDVVTVARALNRLLPKQVFCDAFTFDSFWLHRLFHAADIEPEFQLESVSVLLNRRQVKLWPDARQQVISELGLPVHRAENDALILSHTWQRLSR
jgi:hypothetical protein